MSVPRHFDAVSLTKTVLTVFCAILAIVEIAVQSAVLKRLRSHSDRGHTLPQDYPGGPVRFLAYVPESIDYAVNNLSIASSAIALAAALVCNSYSLQRSNNPAIAKVTAGTPT